MTSLNQIIKLFQDIATNHNQIQSFGFGDLWEYSANHDGLTKNKKTPTFWAVLEDSNITDNELTLNFSLLFFDLVKKDEFNETEVLSDTLRIATDVWAVLDSDNFYDNFTLTKTANLQDFTERFDDEVAGWKMSISLRIQGAMDSCSAPITIPTITNIQS